MKVGMNYASSTPKKCSHGWVYWIMGVLSHHPLIWTDASSLASGTPWVKESLAFWILRFFFHSHQTSLDTSISVSITDGHETWGQISAHTATVCRLIIFSLHVRASIWPLQYTSSEIETMYMFESKWIIGTFMGFLWQRVQTHEDLSAYPNIPCANTLRRLPAGQNRVGKKSSEAIK